jgi:hypothetical protein
MSKLIYLASPYSHPDKQIQEENFKQISRIAAKMAAKGEVAISPITYGHTLVGFNPDMPTTWEFWEEFCLSILIHCSKMIVVKMQGWENSKGIKGEIEFALKHGIEVDFIEYSPDL